MERKKRGHRVAWSPVVRMTLVVLLALAGLLQVACLSDPDHTNPLDPESAEFDDRGRVLITVESYDDQPLSDAWVRLQGYNLAQQTDGNGTTEFLLPAGQYFFQVEKEDYTTVLGQVGVEIRGVAQETVNLNGRPRISNVDLTTTMDDRGAVYRYSYVLNAELYDPDTITDLVELQVLLPDSTVDYPNLPTSRELSVTMSAPYDSPYTNSQTFSALFNKDFRFIVVDELEWADTTYARLDNFFYYPLLDEEIKDSTEYPIGGVDFQWRNIDYNEEIAFTPRKWGVRIRTDFSTYFYDTTFVFTDEELPETLNWQITDEDMFIPYVSYYWELTVYDNFDNLVRSGDHRFQVTNVQGD